MTFLSKYMVLAACCLAVISCGHDELDPEQQTGPVDAPLVDSPEEWHDKIRTLPYPKMSNELYINPSPLIVPQSMKTGKWLKFMLSQDLAFPDGTTVVSDTLDWNMFNPHKALETGIWYWKYCNVAVDGQEGEWSDPIAFNVAQDVPQFVTPDFDVFRQNLPQSHPRLYYWLQPYIAAAREQVERHEEYSRMTARAETALSADYDVLISTIDEASAESLSAYAEYLYQAAYLTEEERYAGKLKEILGKLLSRGVSDSEFFSSNFCATYIAGVCLLSYDLLYDGLTAQEKSGAETLLSRYLSRYFSGSRGYEENHIFDNHFWQKNMMMQFNTALCLYDKAGYAEDAVHALEYYYELCTARAPASGFNRDGAWINGTGYFEANVKTLAYMPMMLSYITRFDFLRHPWYLNAGEALVYSWPPDSGSTGFGDNSESHDAPQRQRVAFADFLARELGDAFAGWYADRCGTVLLDDYELRLYRMCKTSEYDTGFPADAPKMKWYKDIGEVVMHSDLENPQENTTVGFRSATFGSGSHTLADQNSFNILHKGEKIYYHSGYYTDFSDVHNLLSYRHTRAHNTILVNGIGQPFSTKGYGMLLRAGGGENISYCLGDASNAYCGISDDPMWIANFNAADVEQSEENGFGDTPLTKYRRQMLMLYPDIILVYDELEAASPSDWDWLLHSPVEFTVDRAGTRATSVFPESGSAAAVDFFSGADLELSQTDEFFSPPVPEDLTRYPAQWHLTAKASDVSALKILAVIRIGDSIDALPEISVSGGDIFCGDWKISVSLQDIGIEYLQVCNAANGAVYSYGSDNPVLGGSEYMRMYNQSSILYDVVDGEFRISESYDESPIYTKSTYRPN